MKQFRFDIDCTGKECPRYEPRFATYGSIVTQGDTLEELVSNATVDIVDQDGDMLYLGPADEAWMEERIETEFWREHGVFKRANEDVTAYFTRAAMEMAHRD